MIYTAGCGSVGPDQSAALTEHTTQAVVDGALIAMTGSGPGAETLYQQNVAQLRARSDAVEEVTEALHRAVDRATARRRLIYLLGELGDGRAVRILERIASAHPATTTMRQAPTRSARVRMNSGLAPVAAVETMERRAAVWALEKLVDTTPSAVNALRGLLKAPDREVRFAAAFALYRKHALSGADKAVMASTGASGVVRVRSSYALTVRTQPSVASRQRFRQKHQAALQGANASAPPLVKGAQP